MGGAASGNYGRVSTEEESDSDSVDESSDFQTGRGPYRAEETLLQRKTREATEEVIMGCWKMAVMALLLVVIYYFGSTCCMCLWVVMLGSLMLMIFAGMTRLWVVLVLAFFGTFWAGCQVENHWVTVNTKWSVR